MDAAISSSCAQNGIFLASEADKANDSCELFGGIVKHYKNNGNIRCYVKSYSYCPITVTIRGYLYGDNGRNYTELLPEVKDNSVPKRKLFSGFRTSIIPSGHDSPSHKRQIDFSGQLLTTNTEFSIDIFSTSSQATSMFYCIVVTIEDDCQDEDDRITLISTPIAVYTKSANASRSPPSTPHVGPVFMSSTNISDFISTGVINSTILIPAVPVGSPSLSSSPLLLSTQTQQQLQHRVEWESKQIITHQIVSTDGGDSALPDSQQIFTLSKARSRGQLQSNHNSTKGASDSVSQTSGNSSAIGAVDISTCVRRLASQIEEMRLSDAEEQQEVERLTEKFKRQLTRQLLRRDVTRDSSSNTAEEGSAESLSISSASSDTFDNYIQCGVCSPAPGKTLLLSRSQGKQQSAVCASVSCSCCYNPQTVADTYASDGDLDGLDGLDFDQELDFLCDLIDHSSGVDGGEGDIVTDMAHFDFNVDIFDDFCDDLAASMTTSGFEGLAEVNDDRRKDNDETNTSDSSSCSDSGSSSPSSTSSSSSSSVFSEGKRHRKRKVIFHDTDGGSENKRSDRGDDDEDDDNCVGGNGDGGGGAPSVSGSVGREGAARNRDSSNSSAGNGGADGSSGQNRAAHTTTVRKATDDAVDSITDSLNQLSVMADPAAESVTRMGANRTRPPVDKLTVVSSEVVIPSSVLSAVDDSVIMQQAAAAAHSLVMSSTIFPQSAHESVHALPPLWGHLRVRQSHCASTKRPLHLFHV